MGAFLESLFDAFYRAYRVALAAFKFVDLLVSVVASAIGYALGAVIRVVLAVIVQAATVYGIYCCFFPPESPSKVIAFAGDYPVFCAFGVFAVGETAVVLLIFALFRTLLTFKLQFLFDSDKIGKKDDPYSPFDDEPTEAIDPLSF